MFDNVLLFRRSRTNNNAMYSFSFFFYCHKFGVIVNYRKHRIWAMLCPNTFFTYLMSSVLLSNIISGVPMARSA